MRFRMSTVTKVSGTNLPFSANVSTLSTQEIRNKIASINANQIEAIAKRIIAQIMDRLGIDVSYGRIPGQAYSAKRDQTHPGIGSTYDSSSELMKVLLPPVIKQITDAFSTPSEFVKNGITFQVIASDNTGLIDQITDESLQPRISAGIANVITSFHLNSLTLSYHLVLNVEETRRHGLSFNEVEYLNGLHTAHNDDTIQSFEKSVINATVRL